MPREATLEKYLAIV
jgi:hypothetical protein